MKIVLQRLYKYSKYVSIGRALFFVSLEIMRFKKIVKIRYNQLIINLELMSSDIDSLISSLPNIRKRYLINGGTDQSQFSLPKYVNSDFYPQIIIDIGAYIGLQSIFFNHKFPNAHIHAIEPNSRNFSILNLNLSQISQAKTHFMGISNHEGWGNSEIIASEWNSKLFFSGPNLESVEITTLPKFLMTKKYLMLIL